MPSQSVLNLSNKNKQLHNKWLRLRTHRPVIFSGKPCIIPRIWKTRGVFLTMICESDFLKRFAQKSIFLCPLTRLVCDDQNPVYSFLIRIGLLLSFLKKKETVVPRPGVDSIWSSPSCSSRILWARGRPMPICLLFLEKKCAVTYGRSSSFIPQPWSVIVRA